MASAVAAAGVYLLAGLAPFETTTPLLRLPGQSISNLEALLGAALAAWIAVLIAARRPPDVPFRLAAAWFVFVGAMSIAAAAAPVLRTNAWHMAGRFAAAGAVCLLTIDAATQRSRREKAIAICAASGVAVAVIAVLEYVQFEPLLRVLTRFRPGVTAVGAQIRAGGTLQYPTIASMYLEVAFALGLGLLLSAMDRGRRRAAAVWFIALVVVAEAIVLTFTRAGIITMASSLAAVGLWRSRRLGFDAGGGLLASLAAVVLALLAFSRSADSLWLRMTTEAQNAWYRAEIDAPSRLAFETDATRIVTVGLVNTGRVRWDSTDDPPICLSYHWLKAEEDGVVAYEGDRTDFERPVNPGDRVTVRARVRAPRRPGAYRLEWDLVQEGRLWFSTEPDAPASTMSAVTVTGAALGGPLTVTPRPHRAVRPGRLVLWRAAASAIAVHPWLGLGPDNFRLLYGRYAGLANADPRIHTNNMYLEILAGGGLFGAAAFVWLLREAYRVFASGREPAGGTSMRIGEAADASASIGAGLAAAGAAIAIHGCVDAFLGFAPTYILFSLTLGFAAAHARYPEVAADAHRV